MGAVGCIVVVHAPLPRGFQRVATHLTETALHSVCTGPHCALDPQVTPKLLLRCMQWCVPAWGCIMGGEEPLTSISMTFFCQWQPSHWRLTSNRTP